MQALLIIDVQNDYFPGGNCTLVGADAALTEIQSVLAQFRTAQLPVIYVQHFNAQPGATFFLPDTMGVQIHPAITPQDEEPVVQKRRPNSFYQTELLELLRSRTITELVVCGMMTHMCIDTTVRAAKDYDIPVTLLYDACATKDLSINGAVIPAQTVHAAYMAGLNGMFAQVIPTAQFRL